MLHTARPDILAAGLFATIGAIGLAGSRGLEPGTLMRMGPGYMPTVVATLLLLLSAALAARAAMTRPGPDDAVAWDVRPIAAILAGLGTFALLIDPVGLVGATAALIVAARFASRPLRPLETAALVLAAALFSALVFVHLLQLPIQLWPA
ncbi:tripartite tricarboxylate transporter TctB family protein [Stella humosa]|uniref:Tripartite tricarboxylate transporter TctB family protein n=1 Tax=Stella humosa TaxID=94 RepID=A0A3N1KV81_9PROT|nr:tripartite tricarboxylate transporter TctB family protein [Stella humosa]ROP84491.1 tripartite tricarboxylate transporter TctB family protein [Stella humosa]BBK34011.1 tripartite tricarboxylate transporter TctB [Stella humosa]